MPSPSAVHTQLTDAKATKFSNRSGASDLFVRDRELRGFGLRVSRGNTKSFFVEATVNGRFLRRVIGQFPLIRCDEARKQALGDLRALRYGTSPFAEKQRPTAVLGSLVDAFLTDKANVLRPSTLRDYRAILKGVYFSDWHDRPVIGLARREILDRYQLLCAKHGVAIANRSMRTLSSLFNYSRALFPELEDWANPVRVLADAKAKRPVRARTRHIPIDRLGQWLNALDTYKATPDPKEGTERRADVWLLLHLLLMTGMRSNEARSMQWSDIDLDRATFRIKEEVSKNHRGVVLPLNSWLVEQLRSRQRADGYVFPNPAEGYIRNFRRPLERIAKLSGITISPHDLRRTYATYLDAVGAPFGVIKQLLNHASSGDVTERYIQRRSLRRTAPVLRSRA